MTSHGYDFKPPVGSGKYLTLKKIKDLVDIRIVSTPLHKAIHWKKNDEGNNEQVDCIGETCVYCDEANQSKDPRAAAKEIFGWIVLDRNDDNKPKLFKGGTQIYLAIKGLAETKAWGNPLTYDIEIERTEEKPMFYRVTPQPDKSQITTKEMEAVKKSGLNLEVEMVGGEVTNTFGKGDDVDPEKISKEMDEEATGESTDG